MQKMCLPEFAANGISFPIMQKMCLPEFASKAKIGGERLMPCDFPASPSSLAVVVVRSCAHNLKPLFTITFKITLKLTIKDSL